MAISIIVFNVLTSTLTDAENASDAVSEPNFGGWNEAEQVSVEFKNLH